MFNEPSTPLIPPSLPLFSSSSLSPISSTSASPLSSAAHSRTSTITSNSSTKTATSNHLSSQQQQRHMKIGNYFLERTIGKGNFAVVKLATHCDTHQKVAIKIIDKSRLDPADHRKLEREIAVMKSLVHPYIIRLYEVMESKNLIYLVTEYAANGELLDLLIREKRLSEVKAREKFKQLVLAVEYIHSKNIVHRDLKAENLLLDGHGNIKVADFGFANIFKPNTKLHTFCGSPPYAAPELYQCLPYTPEKVDVWSLGVLLYVFVCGQLPFDSNNLAELRKRVLSGQFRLPFYISPDCSSLISHMLTVDPNQRYSINDIKQHSWMMNQSNGFDGNERLTWNTHRISQTQSMPNCQLTNAILDHAESLGYNRTQILKSVSGNSYDSDAAIWHLLLEKFQQTCQIDNSHIPLEQPELDDDGYSNEIARRSTAPLIFDDDNAQLAYCAPNPAESIRPQLDPCDLERVTQNFYNRREPEIRIDDVETFDDVEDSNDEEDEQTSAQLREHYARTHGLRRHTIGKPDLLIHGGPIPALATKVRFAHQSSSIEPGLLTDRLTNLQQQQQRCETTITPDDDDGYTQPCTYHPRHNPHSNSYNGLSQHSPVTITSDMYGNQQQDKNWLSPPAMNNFNMNRRASDSGAHLLLFQQQCGVNSSNQFGTIPQTHLQSPSSNRSSRGSITRGAPITPPTFSITPHEAEEEVEQQQQRHEDDNNDDDDADMLNRYLNSGKRHTVCEQGGMLGGKARRGVRESAKDRGPLSRRASDTISNVMTNTTRAHLERLYNNAVNLKTSDDDLTTSSLQELQKLQKQVQKYPSANADSPIIRRAAAVPSPTNSAGLQVIREEHQQQSITDPTTASQQNDGRNPSSSSSSSSTSSEILPIGDDAENQMECDFDHHTHRIEPSPRRTRTRYPIFRSPQSPSSFYCNTSPLLAQHMVIPTTTTTSSYVP